MAVRKRINDRTKVEAIVHDETRKNIPTEELRDFVAAEETAPRQVLYPRDPSLDPQLVWKGKDEQDRDEKFTVPAVPIYIQEKVHPQAIIQNFLEDYRRMKASGDGVAETFTYQCSLFDDFNGLPEEFDQRVDFYHHDQNWSNRMVLGDSLLVMTSLAEKEGLKGKVQMIYLDPPYGIKFNSNWQVSTRKRNVTDGKAEDLTRQPEQVKAFRDTWKLGIHSYLSYLRDRFTVARELLTESGSIFVQIGDENVHLVRCVMDEVFGSENYISQILFRTTANLTGTYLGRNSDSLLWYAKGVELAKYRQLFEPRTYEDDIGGRYSRYELPDKSRHTMSKSQRKDISLLPEGARIYRHGDLTSQEPTPTGTVNFNYQGQTFHPGNSRHWTTTVTGLRRLDRAQRLAAPTSNSLTYIRYLDDFPVAERTNIWSDTQTGAFTESKVYVVQTNTKVIERCLLMTTDPGDLVLDPTCGSGTTAYVAEQWGRRWITCDTSRVALALARTRLMAARYPYYLLADSPEGRAKEAEITGVRLPEGPSSNDVRLGFVYTRVPHITLKSIANNEEIDAIYAAWQAKMEPLRAEINAAADTTWEEWEIPRSHDDPTIAALLDRWWTMRRTRQKEIDASIARRADTEYLYDQPYEDKKRVRVTGPFTVESLSPHRVLPADEDRDGVVTPTEAVRQQDFTTIILDNLRVAGVQNTQKGERLRFETLEPYAGKWLQAVGTYREADGTEQRVAISIGPEHGTVGPEQVKEAAKEAVQGLGFDVLIVCGFAFDPHVGEEVKKYGRLTVLPARMNPDLAMGEDLLKKTGSGNLFMVFGEPDIEILSAGSGQISVVLRGVDVYDPTTGQIRSNSTDEIACWFVDTDYNGEAFFVRHAYFTGADAPYTKLKRALRAEIDEEAWSSLYRTESRLFIRPKQGKIAVKVINHYGDEVLKVFDV